MPLAALLLLLSSAIARAQPAGIVLPVDVSGVSGDIAVEIDGTDLTEFVQVEAGQIVVLASAALAPGQHVAVIHVAEGDGYRVFATYTFDVSAAPALTVEISANHEAAVQSVNEVTEGHVASTGTVSVATVDDSLTASLRYVADTREGNQIAGRLADIAEYSVEYRQTTALLDLIARAGHQSLGFDPALVADQNRRGLSVEGAGPEERVQFHLFALSSSQIQGSENLSGVSVEEDRTSGARLAVRPFAGSDLRLSVQGYEGRAILGFSALSGVGEGEGLSLDGSLLDSRLRYELAWGRTRWDGDGPGILPEDEGVAMVASLAFDAEPANGAALTLGLDYERVDQFYFSLMNPGLPTGAETVRLSADYAAERLTLYGSLETALTNQGGNPDDPVDRVNRLALDGTWAVYDAGLLSDATVTFGLSAETIRRVETPFFAPPPEDWAATTAYLGLEQAGDTTTWSLVYTVLEESDDGPSNFDLSGHEVQATLDLAPSDRLTLAATALAGRYDSTFSGSYQRLEGDLGLDFALKPGLWDLGLDLGLSATTEPGVTDGAYAAATVTRSFGNGGELILNAGWYDGSSAATSDQDAILGLTYRVQSEMVR